jgi:hypothetical protein
MWSSHKANSFHCKCEDSRNYCRFLIDICISTSEQTQEEKRDLEGLLEILIQQTLNMCKQNREKKTLEPIANWNVNSARRRKLFVNNSVIE